MIVVESSATVDALSGAPGATAVRAALSDGDLHAPTLLDYEVVSAVRGLVLGGHLTSSGAHDVLTDFDDLPVRRWELSGPLRRRVFDLRANLTAYDAAYVVLAEALDCPLLTRDARLARAAGSEIEIWLR